MGELLSAPVKEGIKDQGGNKDVIIIIIND